MDRRVARTRRNIYLAFFSLLQKKTMDEITVTELAALADVDRKTFYSHYQTVQDVFEEFKSDVYAEVLNTLAECRQLGAETEEGFDFCHFYDSMNRIMLDNLAFFEKLSRNQAFMFLKDDFKDILKQALIDFYKDSDNSKSEYEISQCCEFVAAGTINLWTDWLNHKQVSLEEFCDSAIKILKKAWNIIE
ncbi:MAG: TetR/AcrR family transcriptional regulator [Clostridia bacterium]|nr:TetR/AcrR family transcriptional regulator [Clostridia bacterium]MBR6479406.1 TetR/AcrR family transcriptional regulator [Clostridia bacterium]MBR6512622.1 TetR/AcrR family transcriptional regulator [Clostridia bacterium]